MPEDDRSSPPHNLNDSLQVLNLRHYFQVIRERWLLAAAAALVVCSLLGYVLISRPPVYESRALLLVDRAPDHVVDVPEVVTTGLGNDTQGTQTNTLIHTHIGEMTNRHFIQYVLAGFSQEEIEALIRPYAEEPWWHPRSIVARLRPPAEEPAPIAQAIDLVQKNLRVRRVEETLMIDTRFSHRDAEVAAAVANGFVQRYIASVMERSAGSHVRATEFLRAQADGLRQKVETLEEQAQAYREKHNLVSLEENQNIVAQRVGQVSSALTHARLQRVALQSRLEQVEELISQGAHPRELVTFPGFAFLQGASEASDVLQREREVLSERYLENHPQMRENLQAMEALEQTTQVNLAQALGDLRNQYVASISQEQELLEELGAAEETSLDLAEHSARYDLIHREVQLARASYSQLLNRLQETTISAQLANTNLRIAEPAAPPARPSSPQLLRVGLMVAFTGGLMFVGLPLGLNAVDLRLRHSADVETYLRRPLLGEIPILRRKSTREKAQIGSEDDDNPAAMESFRGIYSFLTSGGEADPAKPGGRIFSLVSSMPGEGKTFLAANLARTAAAHGKRSLLIDCDLRGPSVASVLNLGTKGGLEDYLSSGSGHRKPKRDLSELMVEVSEGFSVLPTGKSVRMATELLEKGCFGALLEECRKEFDLILIDTPPLKVFPDALQIVSQVDELIYVCEFGRIPRQVIKELMHRAEHFHGKPVAGIVLNKMPVRRSSLYYYSLNGYYGDADYSKYYRRRQVS